MDNNFTLKWVINEGDSNKLLKQFLFEQEISKKALTKIKYDGGKITVNGNEVTVRYLLQADDRLVVHFPKEIPSEAMLAEKIDLDIVYEDDYFLIVNKGPFTNTIPSREHPTSSVANGLLYYYKKSGLNATIHVVTRLDRDTSGLLLVAKHRHIHHLFSKQQRANEIVRQYEALAQGHFKNEVGTIEQPIGRKPTSIIEREVNENGQFARTHFKVLQSYDKFTHLKLKLYTGRTHQIRVHLAHIGHPLLGDTLYGGSEELINRQALHCSFLQFYHPLTKEKLQFTSKLDNDMLSLIENNKRSL